MKIYVAGHRGMVGRSILRELTRVMPDAELVVRSRDELNLLDQAEVFKFLRAERPDYIFNAAAKVGGIWANNSYPAQFIYENLAIETNLIHGAYIAGVRNLMFLASSCIYPRDCQQPIKEEYLLTGPLEKTNEPYAIAKIAGLNLCESYNRQYGTNYISLMPTNLYGPGDNYDLLNSHVLPALIRKTHEAKINCSESVVIWGSGKARREFMFVDDLASACIYFMRKDFANDTAMFHRGNNNRLSFLNIGTGNDLEIEELAKLIFKVIGFEGTLQYDLTRPDGTPQKLLDVSRANTLGWKANTRLEEGLLKTYEDFLLSHVSAKV